jgi:hypothetical protein
VEWESLAPPCEPVCDVAVLSGQGCQAGRQGRGGGKSGAQGRVESPRRRGGEKRHGTIEFVNWERNPRAGLEWILEESEKYALRTSAIFSIQLLFIRHMTCEACESREVVVWGYDSSGENAAMRNVRRRRVIIYSCNAGKDSSTVTRASD